MNYSWNENSETGAMTPARHRLGQTPGQIPARAVAPPPLDPTGEPVIIGHAVTVILAALVTAGWVAIPNTLIDAIGTAVALVLATVGAVLTRARVSPVKGGIWQAIGTYVADLVAAELDAHPVSTRR